MSNTFWKADYETTKFITALLVGEGAEAAHIGERVPESSREEAPDIMVTISEVKGNTREIRTSAHTHIKGLGLRSDGYAESTAAGFVGQAEAREVCFVQLLSKIQVAEWTFVGMRCCRGSN